MQPLLMLRESEAPTVDGRMITARICTYGRVYDIGAGKRERVRVGAFRSPLARPGGVVRFKHVGERPGDVDNPENIYGGVKILREQNGGLYAELELLPGPRADHLLEIVRTGTVSGVSMAATVADAVNLRDSRGVLREIRRVSQLWGVSITDQPAYDDAEAVALREKERRGRIDAAQAEVRTFRQRHM